VLEYHEAIARLGIGTEINQFDDGGMGECGEGGQFGKEALI